MDAEQLINEMLDEAETPQEEENILNGAAMTDPVRSGSYGVNYRTGRFIGKVTEEQAVIHRVIKYLMTPRGEVPVYPGSETEDMEDNVYGSYIFSLVGEVYPSDEDIMLALQGVCDLALKELDDVESLTVTEATILQERVDAKIIIQLPDGIETEVEVNGIGI